jgi:protein-S-isoprenylcysteine O-methyltransferase Ste14
MSRLTATLLVFLGLYLAVTVLVVTTAQHRDGPMGDLHPLVQFGVPAVLAFGVARLVYTIWTPDPLFGAFLHFLLAMVGLLVAAWPAMYAGRRVLERLRTGGDPAADGRTKH